MSNIDKMRPKDLHDRILLLRERDGVSFYLAESAGFVECACPVCGGEGDYRFRKYGYTHSICRSCETLYCSPRPTHEALIRYYSDYEAPAAWNELLVQTNDDRKYLQHLPRVDKLADALERSGSSRDSFVEIGAGNGNFSRAIQERGLFESVLALDISETCVESCRAQGLEARLGTIEDLPEQSVDCIAFNDLIEHVFDPRAFVASCVTRLRKGGVLLFSTPNGAGFDFRLMQADTVNITPPEHIQYLNPGSARALLEQSGLEVIEISTPGILDVDIVRRECRNGNLELDKDNVFLDYILNHCDEAVRESFQHFLSQNNLSSHMLAIAFKK